MNLGFKCADAARDIANFSVGLAKLVVRENVEDAIPAGSGTLVTIGSVAGILTAAHVVKNLPDAGDLVLIAALLMWPFAAGIRITSSAIFSALYTAPHGPQ